MKTGRHVLLALLLAAGLLCAASSVRAAEPTRQEAEAIVKELKAAGGAVQPIGQTNDAYARYFTGQSYLAELSADKSFPVHNVTFAHGAHTFWHIHHNTCQVLIAEAGRGCYQLWGEAPQLLLPGQTATIPAGVKHWHGALPGTSFQHVALMKRGEGVRTEWLEPVKDADYKALEGMAKPQAQKVVQTAGRDRLGGFAPEFARYNDDILFGEVWSRSDRLPLRERSIVTVSALVSSGILDSSLKHHIASARKNGITREEMAEIITQLGFYAGWPKAWAAFGMAQEAYREEQ
jgi:4-carboxymuconolactone decarboxylase